MFRGLFPHGTVEERLRTGLLVPSTRLHGFVSTRVYPSGRPVLEVNSVPIVIPRGYIRRYRYLFRMLVFMVRGGQTLYERWNGNWQDLNLRGT